MLNCFYDKDEVLTVDIHGLKVWEATLYLNQCISELPNNIKEVIVIHGYHNGKALSQMVRKELVHKRIVRKFLGLNAGRTSLILS